MLRWTKTTRRHALGSQFQLFLQLGRSSNWLWRDPQVRKLTRLLKDIFGPDYTELPRQPGEWFARRTYNENWHIDIGRRRIYIKDESTLSLILLTDPEIRMRY